MSALVICGDYAVHSVCVRLYKIFAALNGLTDLGWNMFCSFQICHAGVFQHVCE